MSYCNGCKKEHKNITFHGAWSWKGKGKGLGLLRAKDERTIEQVRASTRARFVMRIEYGALPLGAIALGVVS